MQTLYFILPELFLSITIMSLLLLGVFIKKSFKLISLLTNLSLIFAIALTLNQPNEIIKIFNDSYIIDPLSIFMKVLTMLFCFFVLFSSKDYIKSNNIDKIEYPIIILASTLGMILMISSYDLIIFYLGLELQSLCLYILASFKRNDERSTEAGLKYFVLSALSSGLLLYGCSLVYGFTGSTNFEIISTNLNESNTGAVFGIVFIIVGLAFKVSAVPFHMWTPDVYEGSPTSVTSFFALVPKIAAISVFIRFMYVPFLNMFSQWQTIIVFLSIASMILGAVAAIGQTNIKRLMAYSSIGHMGYALAGLATGTNLGIQSTIIYLTIYLVMNLGAFGCIFMMKRENIYYENINDLSGLSKNHPMMALSFLIILFSLAGIPPLAGFFAKFYVFVSVVEAKMYFLAVIGLVTTVISAFYYLRIIKIIYFDKPKKPFETNYDLGLKISLIMSSILILIYFIYPSILIDTISSILIY
ncbi:MAG: NADH-quinone oxidoreductase subunit NuoN [Candidatus Pelagibacterales bacterium]|nr:MAG: NADH-quinone oxidoreductase subunit NuoN [Pelagibacterales bacterium]